MSDRPITDHSQAAVEYLQWIIDRLKAGESPEDMGAQVIWVGRLMARRI